jgi:hypothetical protein
MDTLVHEAQAWRIRYGVDSGIAGALRVSIKQPDTIVATASPLDAQRAFADSGENDKDACLLIWLPPTIGAASDSDARAESWLAGRRDAAQRPAIRASLRAVRVFWSETRAVVCVAPEQLSDAIDAIARFTLVARRVRALEEEMAVAWAAVRAYTPLTHAVRLTQLRQQRKLNVATVRARDMWADHLRIQDALEQLDPTLSTVSKRLFHELALQASLYERLEMLEDPIEHAIDTCSEANDRLIEAKSSVIGYILELTIIVVLIAELAAIIAHRL